MTGFSIGNMLRAISANTWHKARSDEKVACDRLEAMYGPPDGNGIRIPDDSFDTRDLTVASGSGGGYLASTRVRGYIPALQPTSAAVALGATIETVPKGGGVAVPRGTAAVQTTWLASEIATATESQPTFGSIVTTPKILAAFCEVSRQLLLQSNADQLIRLEFARAAGSALDAAVLAGTGASGQPTGLLNTSGTGAFTGASVTQAALRNAQRDVSDNTGVNGATCGYVTTPAIAELLATRQRFTGSDRALWEGPSADGTVEGCRAIATTGCTAATAIYGDWSRITILQWEGGLVIEVDPFTKFQSGIVGVRLLLPCDVVVAQPAAFSIATSIT